MKPAQKGDKNLVIDILSQSFFDNKSVNYLVKQDATKTRRIRALMAYSFDYCRLFGEVFISDDRKACALIVLPDKKRVSLQGVYLDCWLILKCIGISNLKKALKREGLISKLHPEKNIFYLWFIGVYPEYQRQSRGTSLLRQLLVRAEEMKRPVFLETSTPGNIEWYKKFGMEIYQELDFGYSLFCFRSVNI